MRRAQSTIAPGAILGCLGDGQLGQKLGEAAVRLGYKCFFLGPGGKESPAGHGAYRAEAWGKGGEISDDQLKRFCDSVDACMIEWENVGIGLVERIESLGVPVRPGSAVLRVARNRLLEKSTAQSLGIPVAPYRSIETWSDDIVPEPLACKPSVLKTINGGYDGKGQARIAAGQSITDAWNTLGCAPCILEDQIDFACELSVIVARCPDMAASQAVSVVYGPFENSHTDSILRTTRYPAEHPEHCEGFTEACSSVMSWSRMIADALEVDGLLVCEYFVARDGTAYFNEMAPRPHNSGHLTIDCFHASQFEQYVRAVCRLPWGSTGFHSGGLMTNILGNEAKNWHLLMAQTCRVHLYGKEIRPGRKMGHFTRLLPLKRTCE